MKKSTYGASLLAPTNIAALKEKLPNRLPADGKKPSELVSIPTTEIELTLIDNSPYQPRLNVHTDSLHDLIGSMKQIGKLDEPIKVRPIAGRFELIRGHRRVAAAKELDWQTITAIVEECDDQAAKLSVFINNTGREDLADYELGLMYKDALDSNLASNQTAVATLFSTSQSAVSGCLSILKLPQELLALLDKQPGLFGRKFSATILSLLDEYQTNRATIIAGVLRIVNESGNQNSLETWVKQKIANDGRDKKATPKRVIVTDKKGHKVFSALPNLRRRTITIAVTNDEIDLAGISELLGKTLTSYVEKKEGNEG